MNALVVRLQHLQVVGPIAGAHKETLMKREGKILAALALFGLAVSLSPRAMAQGNPYPSGPIQVLTGLPIPGATYVNYTVNFTAVLTSTDITFAFRNDPGFTAMDDVSVVDITTASGNLISNGGFESNLTGWTYDNVYGATYGGAVDPTTTTNCDGHVGPRSGSNDFCDGAVGSYDAVDQVIATTIGDTYTVSYWLASYDATGHYPRTFQEFCTNGADSGGPSTSCNAVDVAVYAQGGIPLPGVPEPSSVVLLLTSLVGVGVVARKRLFQSFDI